MPWRIATVDKEADKFLEYPTGETAVRTYIANSSTEAIPVDASFSYAAPTGPFRIVTSTVTDTAANPIGTALANRVALSIRNLSPTFSVYLGELITVTADDTATGGWEIGPGEDLHLDLDATNLFYLIATTGDTATVKILEIASSSGGGGGGGGSSLTAVQERPSGTIDGSNVTFTISQVPNTAARFILFLNGVYQEVSIDYTRSGTTITMNTAPVVGQILNCFYEY